MDCELLVRLSEISYDWPTFDKFCEIKEKDNNSNKSTIHVDSNCSVGAYSSAVFQPKMFLISRISAVFFTLRDNSAVRLIWIGYISRVFCSAIHSLCFQITDQARCTEY